MPLDLYLHCRNCRLPLGVTPGAYCPNCGQATAEPPSTAAGFFRKLIADFVSPDSRPVRTLGLLLFQPGELTRRYLAGQKTSYVQPVRLYFTASIVFFLVVKVFSAGNPLFDDKGKDFVVFSAKPEQPAGSPRMAPSVTIGRPPPPTVKSIDESTARKPFVSHIECELATDLCSRLKSYLAAKYHDQTIAEVGRQVRDRMVSLAPYAMFVLLPVFALITRVLYLNRRLTYGSHLVYALHVNAFAFLLLLVIALVNESFTGLLAIGGLFYFWLAMRHVFGGRGWTTALRYAFIAFVYPVLLVLVILFTLIAAFFV